MEVISSGITGVTGSNASSRRIGATLGVTQPLATLRVARARNRDLQLIKKFYLRKNSAISSNSNYSSSMAEDIYDIKTGVLWPCVDAAEFPEDDTNDVENPYSGNDEYVVNIGKASWVKGTWETIKMI